MQIRNFRRNEKYRIGTVEIMKAIVSVVGKDKPGIIASVSGALAENNVNIEDINQTTMGDNFTMLMYVDISASSVPLSALAEKMKALGEKIGVSIHIQHEDIFNTMHKI